MPSFDWLPAEILIQEKQTDDDYIILLYQCFVIDFIQTRAVFRGVPLALKKHPLKDNKEATFWHMITKGEKEAERTIDYSRAEKLSWVRPTIENEAKPEVLVWENNRKGESRIVLWLKDKDYIVILAKRKNYILPWTAYPIIYTNTKKKLEKEYLSYVQQKTPR